MYKQIVLIELDSSSPVAQQPNKGKIELKPHQQTLLNRCLDLERFEIPMNNSSNSNQSLVTSVGIIGDKVGSGKTLVVLSIIISKLGFAPIQCAYKSFADNHVFVITKTVKQYVNASVVVIPHSLCKQWVDCIKSFCPDQVVVVVNRNNKIEATDWEKVDIVLVTCSMYANFTHFNKHVMFARVFYDEADSINLPLCPTLQSRFYWFVTASFNNLLHPFGLNSKLALQNGSTKVVQHCKGLRNNGFIKELFFTVYGNHLVMPFLICKNKDRYVDESMALPSLVPEIVECKTPIAINILTNIVDREVIRYLNANNLKRAIQCLHPSQRSNEENIIELCLDNLKRSLKNNALEIDFASAIEHDTEEDREREIERLLKIQTDLEGKMVAIKQRIREADECPICQEAFVQRTVANCCNNSFCFKCLSMWVVNKPQCPLCKQDMNIKDVYVIDSSSDDDMPKRAPSPSNGILCKTNVKLVNLVNILRLPTSKKTLVFSLHDETFESVVVSLRDAGITYSFLKGTCSTISSIIERFKQGLIDVLLINPNHYGSGLNLECTTDVIMFHKLDTEMEKQVIGRANRFGRTEPLKVWYLLHANEIPM